MDKHPTEYSAAERRAIYSQLLREERAKIVPSCRIGDGPEWISYAQQTAAKGRATKRFNAMGL